MSDTKITFYNHKWKVISKFGLSSIISFIIDYSIFSILSLISNDIVLCNLVARCVSGSCNYLINKKYVFRSDIVFYKSLLSYSLLAILIITLNTMLLHILVDKISINKFIAKIFVEIILFTGNFIIQKKYVFKRQNNKYV